MWPFDYFKKKKEELVEKKQQEELYRVQLKKEKLLLITFKCF